MSSAPPELTIGKRLRRARQARGLSLQQVATRLARPVTRAALSKYERGETIPRADVLVDLGRVLGVPGTHFLEAPESGDDSVTWIAYRKHSALGARQGERIQAQAELAAGAYNRLLDLLHPDEKARIPARKQVTSPDDAETAAEELRSEWELGTGPLESVVACAEDAGVLVLAWDDHDRFDALSGKTARGRPVVVFNLDRPDDRRRFSVAHEIGHLVMDTGALPPREEEFIAHRFAAAFVVPRDTAMHELGHRRAKLTVAELEHLKCKYGLSMQAWIHRAKDLRIITEEAHRSWQAWFRTQGLRVQEPVDYVGHETPSRLSLLAVQALAEGLVDRNWVRSFCPEAVGATDIGEQGQGLRSLLRMPAENRRRVLQDAASTAAELYGGDPESLDFLEFDDPMEDDDESRSAPSSSAR